MFEKGLLAGKRILVTGGGSGLGAAMGHRFVELGAELIICGRRLEVLEATAARLRSEIGGKVDVIGCDIRDSAVVSCLQLRPLPREFARGRCLAASSGACASVGSVCATIGRSI